MKPQKKVLILTDRPERIQSSRHMQDLLAAIQAQPLCPGRVSLALIRHDPWCKLLADRGPCDCRPDISLREGKR